MKLSEELLWRGFWKQATFTDAAVIDGAPRTLYLGTDPSADSLHVGHLAGYMMVRHFLEAGHNVVLLVGGGTAQIGDMRDTKERELLPLDEIAYNKQQLSQQVSAIFAGKKFTLVDNYDWLMPITLIPFLRDIGKSFNMAELTQRDFFKARIANGSGLSFAEFTYTLLQGYDYYHLHKQHNVTLQIGGSDQWGNLLSGVELIRKKTGQTVHAMTAPLIVNKSTGRKFGKSEGGAVWLDPAKTSPYRFYQFWLGTEDDSVEDYLKIFTMLPKEEILAVVQRHESDPGKRYGQRVLAREVTSLVHGVERCKAVEDVTEVLFGGRMVADLSEAALAALAAEVPTVSTAEHETLVTGLVAAAAAKSNGEARRLIAGGAVRIDGQKVQEDRQLSGPALIKKGKNVFILVTT